MATLAPSVSMFKGDPLDTGWHEVTDAWFDGSPDVGSAGALGGTFSYTGGKLQLAGTPAAVLANGTAEGTVQDLTPPFTLVDGDLVMVKWEEVATTGSSSWGLAAGVTGPDHTTDGGAVAGICGAITKGGFVGTENAHTTLTEGAGTSKVRGVLQTGEGKITGGTVQSEQVDGTWIDGDTRRCVTYDASSLVLCLQAQTINTNQDAGTVSGRLYVRRVRPEA